jgi:S1-C subfamily serine protease
MNRFISFVLILFCLVTALLAQNHGVPLSLRAVLIDKELNQKPVPQLRLVIRNSTGGVAAEAKTSLDGIATLQLDPGKYTVVSAQPLEFQGQSFVWQIDIDLGSDGVELILSNDNARIEQSLVPRGRVTDELTTLFRKYQHSVVTVWSELGHGTGFIIDSSGLILTNQHVLGRSEYIAVQFDPRTKVPAIVLSEDPAKDVAVLWADLSMFATALPAPLISSSASTPVEEGERVFTIGSPLSQRKILTTGIVSKVEPRAIISDININPGNSGGPLFNSIGEVVGITTFGEVSKGPGISGIIRIEEALPLVEVARKEMANRSKPIATLLPVEPGGEFPIEALKKAAEVEKFNPAPYRMDLDKFDVTVITPILRYRYLASSVRAAKEKEKRTKKSKDAVKGTFQPLDELKNWAEYAGEYKPVLLIRATPELAETTGSIFLRALVSPYLTAKVRFKADFYRMKLFCGSEEVQPIHPGKIAHVIDMQTRLVNATDASYEGFYVYPYNGISQSCGRVKLQLFTEKEPNKPHEKILSPLTVVMVDKDFRPYSETVSGQKSE